VSNPWNGSLPSPTLPPKFPANIVTTKNFAVHNQVQIFIQILKDPFKFLFKFFSTSIFSNSWLADNNQNNHYNYKNNKEHNNPNYNNNHNNKSNTSN
jgi:hypothetical protein